MARGRIKNVIILMVCFIFLMKPINVMSEEGKEGRLGEREYLGLEYKAEECGEGSGWDIDLEGKWKVTEYLTGYPMTVSYDFYEHFLGRSIVIERNRIIKSFGYWWDKLEDVVFQYRSMEVEVVDSGQYGGELGEEWHHKYKGQDVAVVTFNGSDKSTFVVTEKGETLCWYLGDIYYMERYKETVTDLKEEQIYGQWEVKRLVSYQDGWKGRNDLLYGKTYKEEEGAYFYPESYVGNMVIIRKQGMEIYDVNGLLDCLEISGYDSVLADKYDYQNEKRIHDELGITNDEIQVFKGKTSESESAILDGEIVAVSESEVIIKIYQGWYLLEKQQ